MALTFQLEGGFGLFLVVHLVVHNLHLVVAKHQDGAAALFQGLHMDRLHLAGGSKRLYPPKLFLNRWPQRRRLHLDACAFLFLLGLFCQTLLHLLLIAYAKKF